MYLLCLRCRRAWTAPTVSLCCDTLPLNVNPFAHADARAWFRASLGTGARAAVVSARGNYGDRDELRASLWLRVASIPGRTVVLG